MAVYQSCDGLTEKVIWQVVEQYAADAGLPNIAPHDLRRTSAKLCRAGGGELEQIQILLGHASVQTTERYLGTRQNLTVVPNDHIGPGWWNKALMVNTPDFNDGLRIPGQAEQRSGVKPNRIPG